MMVSLLEFSSRLIIQLRAVAPSEVPSPALEEARFLFMTTSDASVVVDSSFLKFLGITHDSKVQFVLLKQSIFASVASPFTSALTAQRGTFMVAVIHSGSFELLCFPEDSDFIAKRAPCIIRQSILGTSNVSTIFHLHGRKGSKI